MSSSLDMACSKVHFLQKSFPLGLFSPNNDSCIVIMINLLYYKHDGRPYESVQQRKLSDVQFNFGCFYMAVIRACRLASNIFPLSGVSGLERKERKIVFTVSARFARIPV